MPRKIKIAMPASLRSPISRSPFGVGHRPTLSTPAGTNGRERPSPLNSESLRSQDGNGVLVRSVETKKGSRSREGRISSRRRIVIKGNNQFPSSDKCPISRGSPLYTSGGTPPSPWVPPSRGRTELNLNLPKGGFRRPAGSKSTFSRKCRAESPDRMEACRRRKERKNRRNFA